MLRTSSKLDDGFRDMESAGGGRRARRGDAGAGAGSASGPTWTGLMTWVVTAVAVLVAVFALYTLAVIWDVETLDLNAVAQEESRKLSAGSPTGYRSLQTQIALAAGRAGAGASPPSGELPPTPTPPPLPTIPPAPLDASSKPPIVQPPKQAADSLPPPPPPAVPPAPSSPPPAVPPLVLPGSTYDAPKPPSRHRGQHPIPGTDVGVDDAGPWGSGDGVDDVAVPPPVDIRVEESANARAFHFPPVPDGVVNNDQSYAVQCAGLVSEKQQQSTLAADANGKQCTGHFGHGGFGRRIPGCRASSDGTGGGAKNANLFESTLECKENSETKGMPCHATNLLFSPTLLHVSHGGEDIASVLNRAEKDEFPRYLAGAFSATCYEEQSFKRNNFPHHLQDMLVKGLTYRDPPRTAQELLERDSTEWGTMCHKDNPNVQWIEQPTLMVTRYEYANLYHTVTEWYSTFQAEMAYNLVPGRARVLFMDGHSKGALDDAWLRLFPPLEQATEDGASLPLVSNLRKLPTCFKDVYFVHPGYKSPLFVDNMKAWTRICSGNYVLSQFAATVLARHSVSLFDSTYQDDTHVNVLVVFRKGYLSHPRIGARLHKPPRLISNEREVISAIASMRMTHPATGAAVEIRPLGVYFEDRSFTEQLLLVRAADVIVSMHGAALTHALFMRPNAAVLELTDSSYSGRFHFDYFSTWANLMYKRLFVSSKGTELYHVHAPALQASLASIFCHVLETKAR